MKNYLLLLTVFVLSFTNAQNTLIVDNNVNIDSSPAHIFTTIADAMNAAQNGDTIYVQPSETSYGTATINKEITLLGSGHAPLLNNGRRSILQAARIAASNVKISGFFINTYITYDSSTVQTDNVIIEDNHINTTIYVGSATTSHTTTNNNWTIRGNYINYGINLHANPTRCVNTVITNNYIVLFNGSTNAVYGLRFFNDTTILNNNIIVNNFTYGNVNMFPNMTTDFTAMNNIFISNGTDGMFTGTAGKILTINNSISYKSNGGNLTVLMPGSNNFDNQNPLLTTVAASNFIFNVEDDYTLQASSPGVNAGADGNDIGIYNGAYDFDMRGYPTELPYLTEMTISNNYVPAGSNLNVNLKANANKSN